MINIFGMITGALSGATGGAISIESIAMKAATGAALSPRTELAGKDAPAVAKAIVKEMPAPRAMESLWPQVTRQLLVAAGGILVGKGYMDDASMQIIVGSIVSAAPIIYRVVSTWIARDAAKA